MTPFNGTIFFPLLGYRPIFEGGSSLVRYYAIARGYFLSIIISLNGVNLYTLLYHYMVQFSFLSCFVQTK